MSVDKGDLSQGFRALRLKGVVDPLLAVIKRFYTTKYCNTVIVNHKNYIPVTAVVSFS